MKKYDLRQIIKEEIKSVLNEKSGTPVNINSAGDLYRMIRNTSHKPGSLEVQVLVGNKKLKVYGAIEEDGALKLYTK